MIALQKFSESIKDWTNVVSPYVDVVVVVVVVDVVDDGMYAGLHFGRSTLVAFAQYFVQSRVR